MNRHRVKLHPQIAEILARRAALSLPAYSSGTPAQARMAFAASQAALPAGRGGTVHAVHDEAIPTAEGAIKVRRYQPAAAPAKTAIVYCHGGGWVFGDLDAFDPVCRALARATGAEVVSVDYRLAPEHPFPAALNDAFAALEAVCAETPDRPVAIMGDSAGANLAAACALRARRDGGARIDLQVLVYPITDHDLERPSYQTYGGGGFLLSRADMAWYWACYAPHEGQRLDPLASPLRAPDLAGLPPAIIVVAGCDPLADEGLAYARALEAAGTPVDLRLFEDMTHGFFTLTELLAPADDALQTIATAIAARLAAASPG